MEKSDQLFLKLVYFLQSAGMQALGKFKNPFTRKLEHNLKQAQNAIDMLEMLRSKTVNNVSSELSNAIDTALAELKMNYVEELNKN